MNTTTRRRAVDWPCLPNELLTLIGECLDTRIDVLRFRAVCTSWRSSITLSRMSSPRFPMKLPYPIVPNGIRYKGPVHFTLRESTLYRFEPLDQGKNISNYFGGGWLMKLEERKPGKFCLWDPFSQQQISHYLETFHLQKNLNFLDYRFIELSKAYKLEYVSRNGTTLGVDKVIYSVDHSAVLIIYQQGKLASWKLGDEKWTRLGEKQKTYYKDIMLYKGQFHAIKRCGTLVVINSSTLKITEVSRPLCNSNTDFLKHLVQHSISGGIYLVNRGLDLPTRCDLETVDFEIYKLNEVEHDWVKVKSLVGQVMFLADDCSFFASTKELDGCEGNCIYFNQKYVIKDFYLKELEYYTEPLFKSQY